PCHGGGRRFKSGQGRKARPLSPVAVPYPSRRGYGSVAQLVERTTENREVTGSTPVGATVNKPSSSLPRTSDTRCGGDLLHPRRDLAFVEVVHGLELHAPRRLAHPHGQDRRHRFERHAVD